MISMFKKVMPFVAMLLLGASVAQAEDIKPTTVQDPRSVIETTVTAIIEVLKQRADTTKLSEVDRMAIRDVITGKFDYAEMSRRSVGRDWDDQSSENQAAFTETFRDLMERSYGNRLAGYNGQVITYDDAEFKNDVARVKTYVTDSSKTTPVNYRLHQTPEGWQVYDIKIEGVSLVSTFREDFKSVLRKDGFKGLLDTLKTKVDKMKADDAA
ncbi:MAG: ABC transporter substrate-binding protein [Zetaproteobacteria bacterium]|nr:ABC transporter substrate-binding protein [Zetaproteobacteria bacterium]